MTDADTPHTPVAKTHAEANRLRKDIVLGEASDEARLVRFVVGPDGAVVPDVARKLPGRGMWVDATREAVNDRRQEGPVLALGQDQADRPGRSGRPGGTAAGPGGFLTVWGLHGAAGTIISGFEKVSAALASGKTAWLIEASDGAADGRRKILTAVHKAPNSPKICGMFSSDELGLALGGRM
jgi:hypothetical protein